MINIEAELKAKVMTYFEKVYQTTLTEKEVTFNKTLKEFEGDITLVVFPLVKTTKKGPEQTANEIGEMLKAEVAFVEKYNCVKGFLNLSLSNEFLVDFLKEIHLNESFFTLPQKSEKVVLEYCGPNTNKPLHIGHLRNMFIGFAMGEILKANGNEVIKVNINNDRGIAICKSIAAYMLFGNGTTPASTGIKGDHFVGDFYVKFNSVVKEQLAEKYQVPADEDVYKFIGKDKDALEQETPIFEKAKELLLKWEADDKETVDLWNTMNGWVYKGFQETFDTLGIDFQKEYYESQTYNLGKDIVLDGLEKGIFKKRADGAIVVDLTSDGLDEKVLLRADGTSIYITQDIGTAILRHQEFSMDKMIYVVMNEQDYHFKVLKLILQKMGYSWADGIYHLSYAMVGSPTGRFKSREGKTADADDLIHEVLSIAEAKTKELGKTDGFSADESKKLYDTIGLGALKYFILRVNAYKNIIFNPEESIEFQGHTGPFIQYTHARIKSIIRKANIDTLQIEMPYDLQPSEREVLNVLYDYPTVLASAAASYEPSELANYVYNLAKTYNKFYNECPVLVANTDNEKQFRIMLSANVAAMIKNCMQLLGIDVPEKM